MLFFDTTTGGEHLFNHQMMLSAEKKVRQGLKNRAFLSVALRKKTFRRPLDQRRKVG